MNGNPVTIVKDGKLINVDGDSLSKDDLVVLQAGDIVPADLKLVEARALEIDEFELTGEILPVIKEVGEDDGMIYMGSRILKGTGKGIVVAAGEQTEYGRVLKQEWKQSRPYEFRIFKKQYLGLVVLLLPAFVLQIARSNQDGVVIAFYLSLATVLILLQNDELFKYLLISNELKKLGRLNIHIRDARALEWMNNIDVICFDKTGVLTTRQMDVKKIYFANEVFDVDRVFRALEGSTAHILKMASALCNDVFYFEKMSLANPIDKALITFAQENGINVQELFRRSNRIYDTPFDSEHRYMASGFEIDGQQYHFAKGDPDVILKMCDRYLASTGTEKKVDSEFWLFNNANVSANSQGGDTAIALAYASEIYTETPQKYTFLCLLQLENLLQPGVREIIRGVTEKGIRSILLTGDRAETAGRIGKDCGITKNSKVYLTGKTIDRMDLAEVARQSDYCSVFARLSPSQKGVLIRLLQQKGHSIAMVGDGLNDGIALKVADVGISFVENSSPIARRLSKILINDLADLLRLMEGANRIMRRAKHLKLFRILILVALLFNIYVWVFSSQYF